jgi:bisphosphoglycerate-dependent phosphoglycerate mutase
LQGHLKDSPKLIEVFGEEKVLEWRRSYHTAPPSLYDSEFLEKVGPAGLLASSSAINDKYIDSQQLNTALRSQLGSSSLTSSIFTANAASERSIAPTTESLQMCEQRAFGYWKEVIAPRVAAGERVLIVAHANTIRALVKAVDKIDDNKIAHLKIPNGIPLVYTMDETLTPRDAVHTDDDLGFNAVYLVSARNHGKVFLLFEANTTSSFSLILFLHFSLILIFSTFFVNFSCIDDAL